MLNTLVVLVVIVGLWSAWGFFGSSVEQMSYTVTGINDGYEMREYPAHIVAQTNVKGPYGETMSKWFRIVAGYIFDGNTKKENIAMTAPIFVRKSDPKKISESIAMTTPVISTTDGDSQTISFGMPHSYTMEALPVPDDPRVKIVMIPKKKYAVLRFSWYRSDERIKQMQKRLFSALARDGITTRGSIAYAGYDPPWSPPWMNRHEILLEITE